MYSKLPPYPRRRRRWCVAVTAVAGFTAALVVGVAGAATNVLPNPDFEADCSGVPCSWHGSWGATVTRETSIVHTGAGSLKLSSSASETASASPGCLPLTLAAGTYAVSYWYNNSDPNVLADATRLEFGFYTSCYGAFLAGSEIDGTSTGGWTEATGTVTVPPGAGALIVNVYVSCKAAGPCSDYFDDLDLEAETLAARVSSFTAARASTGVHVRWQTASEEGVLGFHVYREHAGKRIRLDRRLIPAKGSVSGARYSFVDRRAPRATLTYRLQAVGTDGSRTWYGRARAVAMPH